MRKRCVIHNTIQHIYQRTEDKGILFYDEKDYLVFLTIISRYTREYKIRLGAICLMVNHFHLIGTFKSQETASRYIQTITSVYAREYNRNQVRTGAIFHKAFGNAHKRNPQKIRSAFAYVNNNPVEKNLCQRAEEYIWNLLAYQNSPTPFSTAIPARNRSYRLKTAICTVNRQFETGQHISYGMMNRLFTSAATPEESAFLRDYIINLYNPIDTSLPLAYFQDYQTMLEAFHHNTGSEYDLNEYWTPNPDTEYIRINDAMSLLGYKDRNMNFKDLPLQKKKELAQYLKQKTEADEYQIALYLHLDPATIKNTHF